MDRRRTATSNFGVGRRESHDATAFYGRFRAPELSDDDRVLPPEPVADPFVCGDARHLDAVADGSVALVVTSPPYFAGKAYEEELGSEGVPGSYLEYLQLLTEVFAECVTKLEPGGRIAVNVANLGRKPYRSLSADVVRILQDDLGLLLRGELVWQKGEGANGSCAWGSFRSATNPVLRDVTERVVVASKGRFDRARSVKQRAAEGLPYESTLLTEDFLSLTLDLWSIPPESARRVGHPAPFPVELPEQLIRLYTFRDDLVLDPFMGSGSSLVAAARLGRRYVGYDLDPDYVEVARRRVAEALAEDQQPGPLSSGRAGRARAGRADAADAADAASDDAILRAGREGKAAARLAEEVLVEAGFAVVRRGHRVPRTGVTVDFVVEDATGGEWFVDVPGPFTSRRGGLLRMDVVWKALGRAHALRGSGPAGHPLLLLATDLPKRPSEGDTALRAAGPGAFFDAVGLLERAGRMRLQQYAADGAADGPQPGFWASADLEDPSRRGSGLVAPKRPGRSGAGSQRAATGS
ncbi:MAG: site-specific DNA-methyltransferase [Actinomycetota bacterium]|nr:site-specific DNA-methyltransferase [Actinomycetota bacterium]